MSQSEDSPSQLTRLARLAPWLILLCGLVLWLMDAPLWWLGAALSLGALRVLSTDPIVERVRAKRLGRPWALDLAYCLVIGLVATIMMADIVRSGRPVSHDHTMHFWNAYELHEHFLSKGRLMGWSQRMFAGYPAGYLYPPGASLWVNAVHALSFGTLDFGRAYGIAFWAFHVLTGLAAYRFGRTVAGPHVGLLAGILMLTDLSEFRLGGWSYTVNYGVWPQALALDFALLALCNVPAIAQTRRLAPIAWFGALMGIAVICHPIVLIFLVFVLVATAIAAAFSDQVQALPSIARLGLAYVITLLVSCVWLVPFLSTRAETDAMGLWWDSAYELGKGVLALNALPGTLGYVVAFGILGLVVLLHARSFPLLFTALVALLVPATANSSFVDELHLTAYSNALTKVQFMRLGALAKPFWFVVASYLAITVCSRARGLLATPAEVSTTPSSTRARVVRSGVWTGLLALLAVPLLTPAVQAFYSKHVRRSLVTDESHPDHHYRNELERWLRKELPRDREHWRLGVFSGHYHELMDLPALLGLPMWKRGFTPASNFIYQMKDNRRSILESVNLRYALSKRPLPDQDFALMHTIGPFRIYSFRHYDPRPYQVIEGQGSLRVERFSDEEIVLEAAGGASGKLRLNVSYFPRWHAYRDGVELPLSITYLRDSPDNTGFLTVPLAQGRYRFVFERTLGDRLALPITCLGLLLCVGLLLADQRAKGLQKLASVQAWVLGLLERISSDARPRLRAGLIGFLIVALCALFVVLGRRVPPLVLEDLGRLTVSDVHYDFLERLSDANAWIAYRGISQPCLRQGDRLVCRDSAGQLDNERYVGSSPATIEEYTIVRCIRARPEQSAKLSIVYPEVPRGQAIVGYYGIERAGRLLLKRRPVHFTVRVDDRVAHDEDTRTDNHMHWFKIPLKPGGSTARVAFEVTADNITKRFFCFYAQVVDL